MSDSNFSFACPHCNMNLEASQETFGQTVECPFCKGHIMLQKPTTEPKVVQVELPPAKPAVKKKVKVPIIVFVIYIAIAFAVKVVMQVVGLYVGILAVGWWLVLFGGFLAIDNYYKKQQGCE